MATVDITRIASNIGALNSLNSLQQVNAKLATHQTRLSTGKRINSAADDPAGLTIATKMLARSEGLKVALDNLGDAKNMLSVAEAGLSKINDILVQMRNKAQQAASDTLGSSERGAIQTQLQSFAEQIDNIVNETKWNGVKLLDGSVSGKRFQTGVDSNEYTSWSLTQAHTASSLNVSTSYTAAGFANQLSSASLTLVGTTSPFTGLSELTTGSSYQFAVLDKAASSTSGTVHVSANKLTGVSAFSVEDTPGAGELASGNWTIEITAKASSADVSYKIINADTGSTFATVSNASLADGKFKAAVIANPLGVNFTGDANNFQVGDSVSFEYINGGQVKVALKDGQGVAQQIDQDGVAGGSTGTYAYVDAGTSFNSGRGVNATIAAIGTVVTGHTYTFDYHRQGNYIVDVSTAAKAASYMTLAGNSLDVVNSSMADLGSLMARMTFKEDQVTAAQINTESAYSRIMNANMAEEQVNASKFAILQQTATAMLAQANQAPQTLLSLFR